jgi:hypothetical protein
VADSTETETLDPATPARNANGANGAHLADAEAFARSAARSATEFDLEQKRAAADREKARFDSTQRRLEEEEKERKSVDSARRQWGGAALVISLILLIAALVWAGAVACWLQPLLLAAQTPPPPAPGAQQPAPGAVVAQFAVSAVPPGVGVVLLGKILMTAILLGASYSVLRAGERLMMPLQQYLAYVQHTHAPAKKLTETVQRLTEAVQIKNPLTGFLGGKDP